MAIKLNGYTLSNNSIDIMRNALDRSRRIEKEIGSTLCSRQDNVIKLRGEYEGESDKVKIDTEVCDKDEKFLGGYHTHPKGDSTPGITDLSHCGTFKVICTGGAKNNKINCNVWKEKQISKEDAANIAKDINENKKQPTNKDHKTSFNCINTMMILGGQEDYIKELDKDIGKKKLDVLALKNKSGVSESEIIEAGSDLIMDTIKEDILVNILKKEIEIESNKYYNEVEIKLKKG